MVRPIGSHGPDHTREGLCDHLIVAVHPAINGPRLVFPLGHARRRRHPLPRWFQDGVPPITHGRALIPNYNHPTLRQGEDGQKGALITSVWSTGDAIRATARPHGKLQLR
jgi:hypothetical protein